MHYKYLLGSLALLVPSIAATAQCTGPIGGIASYIAALPAAQSFCSSKYPIPNVTSTTTAAAVTVTITVATSFVNTTVATRYTNTTVSTSTVTLNTTNTVTATVTTTATTSTTVTTTTTTPVTTTLTATSTVTTTSTSTASVYSQISKKKRWAPAGPQPAPPVMTGSPGYGGFGSSGFGGNHPAASVFNVFMSTANAAAGSICTCIETPRTTTTTVTPISTTSVTATRTVPVTAQSTNSLTATTSTTLTFTSTTTSTSTVTTTTTFTNTATATTTMSTTTTMTTTSTVPATATATIAPPACNVAQSNGNNQGDGGCSSNCFCDTAKNGNAYCTANEICQNACSTDADCGPGGFCTTSTPMLQLCGQPTCESYNGCSSTYSPSGKRSLKSFLGMSAGDRAGRINEARAAWHAKRSGATCSSRLCLGN